MTENELINIIPTGRKNAVTRAYLCAASGMTDRTVRALIHEARRYTVILNLQNGSGYYKPDLGDKTDREELKRYVKQETSRLKATGWSLAAARRALAEIEN